jgi:hypothetical protein
MTRSVRRFQVTVQAPVTPPTGSSVLSAIRDSLVAASPSAPMWSIELPTTTNKFLAATHPSRPVGATTINQGIGTDGSGSGANRALKGWNDASFELLMGAGGPYSSHWDSTTSEWWMSYGTTGWFPWSQTAVRYQAARDEFRHWTASSQGALDGLWHPYGQAHNFGMSCIDPIGRKLYRTLRPETYSTTVPQADGQIAVSGTYKLCWLSLDNPTVRGQIPGWVQGYGANHLPIEFHPGIGASGSVIMFGFNPQTTRAFYRFDVATQTYISDLPSMALYKRPALAYCNGAIYGASNQPGNVFWRLNANKTVTTTLAPTPVPMNADGNSPAPPDMRQTQFAALGTKIYAFYPGDPVVNVGQGPIYCYDTIADTWTQVDQMVQHLIPLDSFATYGRSIGFTVAPVPELGVIVCAQSVNSSTDVAMVWKP